MTTIVAVRKNKSACLAADSLTTCGDLKLSEKYDAYSDKIFSSGKNRISMAGTPAHELVMRHLLVKHRKKLDFTSRDSIFASFLAMHELLKEKYFLNPKEEDHSPYESSWMDVMIVNESGIYSVFSLREVFEYRKFWAIGAGAEFALGAMYTCYEELDDPQAIAEKGIEASAEFNNATALPITSYCVKLKG